MHDEVGDGRVCQPRRRFRALRARARAVREFAIRAN
jgi:hypothetical protein